MSSRVRSTCASVSGSLTFQLRCGSRRMRAPFAPPRLSLMRNVEADAHAVATSWPTDNPEVRIRPLSTAMSVDVDELVVDGGDRVLPEQLSRGTNGPRYRGIGPMSMCVSLNQTRANASASWCGFSRKRREIGS